MSREIISSKFEAMEKKTFGNLVTQLRKAKGMTQADLAEKMGITDKAVSKWERDLSYPDIASIPHLAEILGVTVDELLTVQNVKKENNKSIDAIISLILRAIGVAMGIAVAVLSILGTLDTRGAMVMLGIGLASLAINSLSNDEK